MTRKFVTLSATALIVIGIITKAAMAADSAAADSPLYLSPGALTGSPDGKTLFVVCNTAKQVAVFDIPTRKVTRTIAVSEHPSGLALTADGSRLFVVCSAPESSVYVLNPSNGEKFDVLSTGHTATAPVLSPDEKTLYVCCRFNNCVAVIDLVTKKELRRIPVQREPVAATITKDGRFLFVANLLHAGRADVDHVAAVVSVIDTTAGKVVKELQLPNGSGSLNDIRISPDGKYIVVSHIIGRFHLPTTQLERGWMNTNAKTIIDVARIEILNTVLLDNVESGAANPWGVAWSVDSKSLVVAHAGTHEVSVINFPTLLEKLAKSSHASEQAEKTNYAGSSAAVLNDLSFLSGLRQRVKLPSSDRGPRAVFVADESAFVANYFSDTISVIDLAAPSRPVESIALAPRQEMDDVRKGEFYFHDATICFQGWQSCSSCHPGDARVDGLNWDLLNDGIGNPKNNKSLLLAHRTPPAMSTGVRQSAEMAVRAGIEHILFTVQPTHVPTAVDKYLKSLKPVPSPHLVNGKLSPSALRGEKVFAQAGCASCHPPGVFTDLQSYDVGTRGKADQTEDRFDTPTLIEVWRTAPYLHDGSAITIREVLTTRNLQDQHGKTSNLTPQEMEDLCAYVLSL